MVLTILDVSWLAADISSIEEVRLPMSVFAFLTTWLVSRMRLSACIAFCAFCRVIDDISSREEDVSSIEAACSDDPCARE